MTILLYDNTLIGYLYCYVNRPSCCKTKWYLIDIIILKFEK
jgi:hypothetical protein